MTSYVNYDRLKKERNFRNQNGKRDAIAYFITVALTLTATYSVYYFVG